MVVRQTIFDPASWVALKHTLRHGAYVSGRCGCRPRVAISASEKFSVAGTSPNGTSCCAATLITVVAMNTTSEPVARNRYRADRADEYRSRMSIKQFLSWMFGQEFADNGRPELNGIGRVYQKWPSPPKSDNRWYSTLPPAARNASAIRFDRSGPK